MLGKRRKYGGYIIHLGVAVMFLGFAGKAFETMRDVTVTAGESFEVGDYRFAYQNLDVFSDDHKTAVTAVVDLFEGSQKIATLTPAKWHYVKAEQPMTEVSLESRLSEDVYIILTGYSAEDQLANFRVYLNPLVNWVWLGFVLLMIGTFICLIPQNVVDNLSPRRRTRLGRAADLAAVLMLVSGSVVGSTAAGNIVDVDASADAAVVLDEYVSVAAAPRVDRAENESSF